jgi:hypothetical protein
MDLSDHLQKKFSPKDLVTSEKMIATFFSNEISGVFQNVFSQVMSWHLEEIQESRFPSAGKIQSPVNEIDIQHTKKAKIELRFKAIELMNHLSSTAQWAYEDPFLTSVLITQKCIDSLEVCYPIVWSKWKRNFEDQFMCVLQEVPQRYNDWINQFEFMNPQENQSQSQATNIEIESCVLLQKHIPTLFSFVMVHSIQHEKEKEQDNQQTSITRSHFHVEEELKELTSDHSVSYLFPDPSFESISALHSESSNLVNSPPLSSFSPTCLSVSDLLDAVELEEAF